MYLSHHAASLSDPFFKHKRAKNDKKGRQPTICMGKKDVGRINVLHHQKNGFISVGCLPHDDDSLQFALFLSYNVNNQWSVFF